MPPRTDEQLWKVLEEQAHEDAEADRKEVASLGKAEKERELEQAGFDLGEIRAEAGKIRERAQALAARPTQAKSPPVAVATVTPIRRSRWAVLAAAATVCALAAGVAMVATRWNEGTEVTQSAREWAEKMRAQGLAACDRREWALCLQRLDRAKEADPEGDRARRVQEARAAAEQALKR
jgi:hypothetical protein